MGSGFDSLAVHWTFHVEALPFAHGRAGVDLTGASEMPTFFDMGVKGFDGSGCGRNCVPRSPKTSLNHWEQNYLQTNLRMQWLPDIS